MNLQEFKQQYKNFKFNDIIKITCPECRNEFERKKSGIYGTLSLKGYWRCHLCGYKLRKVPKRSPPPFVKGSIDPIRNHFPNRPPIRYLEKIDKLKYGRLSKQKWGEIIRGAVKRNLPFCLTMEEAWNLFIKQDGKCALTGLPIRMYTYYVARKYRIPITASLDRIDSTKGYTLDNIQWVHKHVQLMKFDLPQTYFIEMCKKVSDHKFTGLEKELLGDNEDEELKKIQKELRVITDTLHLQAARKLLEFLKKVHRMPYIPDSFFLAQRNKKDREKRNQKICDRIKSGEDIEQVAKTFGLCDIMIRLICKKSNVPNVALQMRREQRTANVKKLVEQGKTDREIAKLLDVSTPTVCHTRNNLGLSKIPCNKNRLVNE